eukprot:gene32098-16614_t
MTSSMTARAPVTRLTTDNTLNLSLDLSGALYSQPHVSYCHPSTAAIAYGVGASAESAGGRDEGGRPGSWGECGIGWHTTKTWLPHVARASATWGGGDAK